MLISHHSGRALQSRLLSHCKNRSRRTLFTETLQSCTNAYLDLAMALPYPPTWPVYSCTIVLVGVASRVALLPVLLWVNQSIFCLQQRMLIYDHVPDPETRTQSKRKCGPLLEGVSDEVRGTSPTTTCQKRQRGCS
jgi:hypothetical protein